MSPDDTPSRLSRRQIFAAAGTVGALATAAAVLPRTAPPEPAPSEPQTPRRGGGYRLSAHVQRYYDTTRV